MTPQFPPAPISPVLPIFAEAPGDSGTSRFGYGLCVAWDVVCRLRLALGRWGVGCLRWLMLCICVSGLVLLPHSPVLCDGCMWL